MYGMPSIRMSYSAGQLAGDHEVEATTLDALGVRTRVLRAGAAARDEAIVFIHGGPGSAEDWSELLPGAGALAPAVAFDLPGWGHADKPAGFEYSPAGWATFIAAALAELGIRRAHAVMSDLGAVSGVGWAAAHPQSVASLTVIGSGIPIGFRGHLLARAERTPGLGRVVSRAGRLGFRTALRWAEPGLSPEVLERWRGGYDADTRRALLRFYRSTDLATLERVAPALRRLEVESLVLWGSRDWFVPVEQAERQRHSLRNPTVTVLDGLRHYPHIEDPDRVAAELLPFLRRVLA